MRLTTSRGCLLLSVVDRALHPRESPHLTSSLPVSRERSLMFLFAVVVSMLHATRRIGVAVK